MRAYVSGKVTQIAKGDIRVVLDAESVRRLLGPDAKRALATFPAGQAANVFEGDEVEFRYETTEATQGLQGPCDGAPPVYGIEHPYHYLVGNATDVRVTKPRTVAEVPVLDL